MPTPSLRIASFSFFAVIAGLATFAEAAPVLRVPGAAQPQLATSNDGVIWLVYGQTQPLPATPPSGDHKRKGGGHGHGAANRPDGDIYVARSNDGGATFTPPTKIATVPKLMLGRRRGPRIAAHGNRITVTLVAHELLAFTSADGGRTWGGPATINDVPTSAREGLHDLAGAADGQLFVTWLDLRNGKMELCGASSRDGGRSWGKNQRVYRSPDKSICECCHPSALFDRDGNLAVMWRNSIEGTRDMWITTKAAGATEFATARKLGAGTWKLNACPMDGGRILAYGDGKFGAVWQRAGDVFLSPPDGGHEILLGKGTQPVAVVRGNEPVVFWQNAGSLMSVRASRENTPQKHTDGATFASVVPARSGGALLAYEQVAPGEKHPSVVVERL